MSPKPDVWHTHEIGACDVIAADFAWFSQRCGEPANIRLVDEDGITRAICNEHAKAARLEASR